jgi:hypothetical protein
VGLLRRHRPARACGAHHGRAALVQEQVGQRLLLPQDFQGWGSDPSAVDKITTGGTAKWTLASYAERDRDLINLYRAEYERQPEEIAKPLKDVIEAAEIFESEKIRKDQFGAIDDAQRAQMSNEAGMSKGATAGSIAIATGCVAASALGQAYIALPCVLGGALYTGAVKLAH